MKLNNQNSKTSDKNLLDGTSRGCVIYARLSVESQNGENESVDRQINLGRKFSEYRDLNIVGIFSDIASGKNDNREEFQKALKLAKSTKSVFWVFSLSRFCRNTAQTLLAVEDLEKSGAELYSHSERLSSDANGKMMLTILSAFNAKERSEIVYRTKFALSEKRKQNKLISNFVPYGYKKDSSGKNLIEIPHQQKIIVLMEKLRDSGLSFQKIADKINKLGEKTSTGKIFLRQTVNQTLQRRAKLVDPVTA